VGAGGLSLVLQGGPQAVSEARSAVGLLARDIGEELVPSLKLLVSELVTNSILHGGAGPSDPVRLDIGTTGGAVRVEVTDLGPGFDPGSGQSSRAPEGGFGLAIVERLASSWGTTHGGRCVWFEIKRDPGDGRRRRRPVWTRGTRWGATAAV
jgi:anti-sigma regulatory factor (Ser/Thr protein kinase)